MKQKTLTSILKLREAKGLVPTNEKERRIQAKTVTKIFITIAGFVSVMLGFIGMFVPLLPTIPFLLLAAACFARSSPRFHSWLLTNRWCGNYLKNYQEKKGMSFPHKGMSITLLWSGMGCTILFVVIAWWVRVFLAGIAIGVSIHLIRIPTFRRWPQPERFSGS